MITTPTVRPSDTALAPEDELAARPRCGACDHDLADHDPIGLRYCEATEAQAWSRTCICRPH